MSSPPVTRPCARAYFTSPPSVHGPELQRALKSGLPLKKLFNTSGVSYREGGWGQKIAGVSEAEALAALAADGKLIKRPFVLTGERVLVGFDEATYAAAFSK